MDTRLRRGLVVLLVLLLSAASASARSGGAALCAAHGFGSATVDVPSVLVRPRFLLNGGPFPATGAGELFLVDNRKGVWNGPQLSLGRTDEPPRRVRLVPGRYDVVYTFRQGAGVPANSGARVGQVDVLADGILIVRVAMVPIVGQKRHNGAPYSGPSAAKLRLVGRNQLGEVALGGLQPSLVATRVIPGTYDLEYDWTAGNALPRNRHARLGSFVLTFPTQNLIFNVPSLVQRVVFRNNGAPFPTTVYERGDLVLRRGLDEEVSLGSSHQQAAIVRLIPGTFAAHWRHKAGGGLVVPTNADAVVARSFVLDGAPAVLDVTSVTVSGDLRVNGQPPPATAYDNGRLWLVTTAGDRSFLGDTSNQAFSRRVVAGTYDVAYDRLAGGNVVPENTRTVLLRGWNVAVQPVRNLDLPTGTYLATLRLAGGAFPGSAYESGRIALLPLAGGDPIVLGNTTEATHWVRVLTGRYRALYSRLAGGGTIVPVNVGTPFGPEIVVAANAGPPAQAALLDVPAGTLSLTFLHNGASSAHSGSGNGRLHFATSTGSVARLGELKNGGGTLVVMPGRYDVYYESLGGATVFPANAFVRLGCWDLHE